MGLEFILPKRIREQKLKNMTTFFEHQRTSYKKGYLKNLILLASMDGALEEEEKALISRIGLKRGLKEWQINELLTDSKPSGVFLPESMTNRMNLLFDFMQVVYADGEVSEKEIEFLKTIIETFKLHPQLMDQMLKLFLNQMPTADEWKSFLEDHLMVKENV
jgi:uncharacterized tellurite resistance protein B-like protein